MEDQVRPLSSTVSTPTGPTQTNPVPAETYQADPTQSEVLLAGNIADDDLMWIVRCSIKELRRMVANPGAWVMSLANLPGWRTAGTGAAAAVPKITPDFSLMVQGTEIEDPDGWVTLQSISGTNSIMLIASRTSARLSVDGIPGVYPTGDAFYTFWEALAHEPTDVARKKTLPVYVAPAIGRFYAHFEILDPADTPDMRAARTVAFLLAHRFDIQGYVDMLNGLPQETLYIGNGGSAAQGKPIHFAAPATADLFSANYAHLDPTTALAMADEGDDPPVDGPPMFCENLTGTYYGQPSTPDGQGGQGGTGTTTGSTVKYYGGGGG